jgi:hypothetical protein
MEVIVDMVKIFDLTNDPDNIRGFFGEVEMKGKLRSRRFETVTFNPFK